MTPDEQSPANLPDEARDAAGRAYFGAEVYLPPGVDDVDGASPVDVTFRRVASVAFRGGWHAHAEQCDGEADGDA